MSRHREGRSLTRPRGADGSHDPEAIPRPQGSNGTPKQSPRFPNVEMGVIFGGSVFFGIVSGSQTQMPINRSSLLKFLKPWCMDYANRPVVGKLSPASTSPSNSDPDASKPIQTLNSNSGAYTPNLWTLAPHLLNPARPDPSKAQTSNPAIP